MKKQWTDEQVAHRYARHLFLVKSVVITYVRYGYPLWLDENVDDPIPVVFVYYNNGEWDNFAIIDGHWENMG